MNKSEAEKTWSEVLFPKRSFLKVGESSEEASLELLLRSKLLRVPRLDRLGGERERLIDWARRPCWGGWPGMPKQAWHDRSGALVVVLTGPVRPLGLSPIACIVR